MRILFTIAHFCDPKGSGPYASQKPDPRPRIEALRRSITALHSVYGKRQLIRDFRQHTAVPVNQQTQCDINVIVCTTRGLHVLADLPVEAGDYTHHAADAEPLLLPFECQAVLRDNLGKYDYYCYLEDDVILHDPWFFIKLDWFCRQATDRRLLQPNRFEVCAEGDLRKAYIDGDVKRKLTTDFQDMEELPELTYSVLGQTIVFERPLNPNAGGYFLNARQMAYWAEQPYFLDRDTRFVGPLESAASLGIMRTFKVYKPAPPHANFLEIQHAGTAHLKKMLEIVSHH